MNAESLATATGSRRRPLLTAFPLYIAAGYAEIRVLLLLLDPAVPAWQPAVAHACGVALLMGWWWMLRRHKLDGPMAALTLVSTAILGPLGYFGAAFSAISRQIFGGACSRQLDDFFLWLSGEVKPDAAAELYRDLILGREQPGRQMINTTIVDLLRWGTPDEKYKMMATLARSFRPELAPALRFALTSSDPTIRIQAAALVAKIEKQFTQRWVALRSQVNDNPHEPERYFALARHLDEYAYTGILDPLRERGIRVEAAGFFRTYLATENGDRDARLFLGRLLTRLGEYSDAVSCLEPVLDDERARSWYCQSLYGLGHFDRLRQLLQGKSSSSADDLAATKITGAQHLWSNALAALSQARPS
jgi:hypothetical protein